jgi:hypothetical protein
VKPRIRILLATLALALLIAPASASAAPSACGAGTGPFAVTAVDTTAPASAWQQGTPAGVVDVALTGTGVQGFEWKLNCGSATAVAGSSGTVPIVGDGSYRFTHRAQEVGTGIWTDWVDNWVLIDSTAPTNTTVAPSSAWRQGPVSVPVTFAADAGSPKHAEWRDGNSGPWTLSNSATIDGTGTHQLQTAAVDDAGNRTERTDVIKIDNTLPVDTTVSPAPGWHDAAVDVTVDGTDADSDVASVQWQLNSDPIVTGVTPGDSVRISQEGKNDFKTRVLDKAGNLSVWKHHAVWVDIAGPSDTTVVPSGWLTAASTVVNVTAEATGASITRLQWRLDGTTTGEVLNADTVPVTVSGDGDHKLEVRVTDSLGRILDWQTHRVKLDTLNPTDTTNVAAGWLPYDTLNVTVRGTDATSAIEHVEWQIDGGNVNTALGSSYDIVVSGQGPHTLATRVVDNAGLASGWKAQIIKLDSTVPTNTSPSAPVGWRNTPYSVVLNGTDSDSGVASVGWTLQLEGNLESAEHVGAPGAETVTISADGTHTLKTRVHDVAGNVSGYRTETIKIDKVAPTDSTVYPSAPVGNRHLITFAPSDDRSGAAGVEWRLDSPTVVQTAASVNIVGEGAHTLSVRVKDNAGNWSGWVDHSITVNLALDTTAPTDTTVVPSLWQTQAYTVSVTATDDVDGKGVDYVQWRYGSNPTGRGASGSTVQVTADGIHRFETRAVDKAGNISPWRSQNLKIDTVKPVDTTPIPAGWTNSRTLTLSATDATSGVTNLEYEINYSGSVLSVANGATVTLPADGEYTISHRALDAAGQSSGWVDDTYKVETVVPVNTSAAAPTGWVSTVSLPLTGTDAGGSTYDHGEWRVDGGDVQTGATALVDTEGTLLLETRVADKAGNVSAWRSETIKVDRTKPVNTTPLPGVAWRKTNYAVTVTGTDATPGSGMARIEYKLDNGATVTTPSVSITTEGNHKLESRAVDVAGNASEWRTDMVGIDKTAPALTVDCGPTAWRNSAATCSVSASGGLSGLPTLTGAVGSGTAAAIANGSFSVGAEGASTINFRAVDGAGNETTTTAAVKIDTVAPAADVKCAVSGATGYVCTASGSDALSGLASLAWSVDGSAPVAVGNGGTFAVQKGSVVVYTADAAGNMAASAPVALADRTPPPVAEEPPTPRTSSEAVLLSKGRTSSARLLGQLSISSLPSSTTVDLRPLALGKGTFQFVIKVTTGKKTKTVTKTQTTKSGYSQRISVKVAAADKASATLTVRKRSGSKWVTYAKGTAKL